LEAAKDIYANVVKKSYLNVTGKLKGFYTGSSNITNRTDNAAAAALALWYATADPTYQNDLYKDLTINDNSTNYGYNNQGRLPWPHKRILPWRLDDGLRKHPRPRFVLFCQAHFEGPGNRG